MPCSHCLPLRAIIRHELFWRLGIPGSNRLPRVASSASVPGNQREKKSWAMPSEHRPQGHGHGEFLQTSCPEDSSHSSPSSTPQAFASLLHLSGLLSFLQDHYLPTPTAPARPEFLPALHPAGSPCHHARRTPQRSSNSAPYLEASPSTISRVLN